jgi:hypothetical protein
LIAQLEEFLDHWDVWICPVFPDRRFYPSLGARAIRSMMARKTCFVRICSTT